MQVRSQMYSSVAQMKQVEPTSTKSLFGQASIVKRQSELSNCSMESKKSSYEQRLELIQTLSKRVALSYQALCSEFPELMHKISTCNFSENVEAPKNQPDFNGFGQQKQFVTPDGSLVGPTIKSLLQTKTLFTAPSSAETPNPGTPCFTRAAGPMSQTLCQD